MAKKNSTKDNSIWELAPAPESSSHVELKEQYELFIDGKWVAPKKKKYFPTTNPSN